MESARCLIEVKAAVLPPEVQMAAPCGETEMHGPHTACMGVPTQPTGWAKDRPDTSTVKVFALTSREWQAEGHVALAKVNKAALEYARTLMDQPNLYNHVSVDWIWL
jgi:hypothetical protein